VLFRSHPTPPHPTPPLIPLHPSILNSLLLQIQVNDWMVVDAIPHLTDFPSMGRAMLQLEVDTLASNSPIEVTLMGPPGGQMPILTFDAAGDLVRAATTQTATSTRAFNKYNNPVE